MHAINADGTDMVWPRCGIASPLFSKGILWVVVGSGAAHGSVS
jgi:hypothetical protein